MTDKLFEWDDSFLIGIDEIDHEHTVLIDDINRLHEKLAGETERKEISTILGDIHARLQAHFALEEHVMKEHKYRLFDEHKREHDEMLETYTECMMQFLNEANLSSRNPIEECLREWVVDHITSSDKKMSLMVRDLDS